MFETETEEGEIINNNKREDRKSRKDKYKKKEEINK